MVQTWCLLFKKNQIERDDTAVNERTLDYLWLLVFEHEWNSPRDIEQEYENDSLAAEWGIGCIEERGGFNDNCAVV